LAFGESWDIKLNKKIHIGTMGWSYNFWVNNFYLSQTKPENFLEEYSKHFDTVEVNSSFYGIPSISTLEQWKNQTPKNFLFSLKIPQKITHQKTETNSDYLHHFFTNVNHLGSKLGPLLFQFPPSFKSSNINFLNDLFSILPKQLRYVLEVRHKSWLEGSFYRFLSENNIALILGDSPWLNRKHDITSDFVYFRWEGNRKQMKGTTGVVEKERSGEIKKWAEEIHSLPDEPEVFGYFSKYYSGHPPTDAKQILTYLNTS
jgi:uncharacterized protein YecE (DUF72 family)